MKLATARLLFIREKEAQGIKEGSIEIFNRAFDLFGDYLKEERIEDLRDVTREVLEDYVSFIRVRRHYRTGAPLSLNFQLKLISPVCRLFDLLHRDRLLLINPAEHIKLPKRKGHIPKDILTEKEVGLWFTSLSKCYGLFGRTLGEILYGTGLRISEVKNLKTSDVDLNERLLFVRDGKGGKDRVVPIPDKTAKVLKKYRKAMGSTKYFLQIKKGCSVSVAWLQKVVSSSAKKAGIEKHVTPHIIRHSIATHLLQRGMDLRFIQELLGHEEIMTTEIYLRVRDEDLKKVYLSSHPRA